MPAPARPTTRVLVAAWVAVGVVLVLLVPRVGEVQVSESSEGDEYSALWIDVALACAGTWIVVVPLAVLALRSRSGRARVAWLVAAALVLVVCWWFSMVSVYSVAH